MWVNFLVMRKNLINNLPYIRCISLLMKAIVVYNAETMTKLGTSGENMN